MEQQVIKPVERFFTAFGQGDLASLLETLHDDIIIEVEGPASVPVYRTYRGKTIGSMKIQQRQWKPFNQPSSREGVVSSFLS